jgi:oxygen-independent coproporphyrinogen-3 oxidase
MNGHQSLSLYLHIPFCRHRCAYCDFNTYTTVGELQGAYGRALRQEIHQVAGQEYRPAHTIFFGGGTPSLMSSRFLGQVLNTLRSHYAMAADTEITLEANPDTVAGDYLEEIRQLGINRLSFGAQSALASELALLEREHSFETVISSVEDSRAAGFENINLDLIYGLPGQTLSSWAISLHAALNLDPDHLSLYCLSIEPGTPMQRWVENGTISPPDPDLAAEQYELACEMLFDHGFVHYEISNWAKTGRECQHNLTYWRNNEYLGLGAGAHGHAAGYRYQVVKQPRVYIRRLESETSGRYPWSAAVAYKHQLSTGEVMSDTIIMQLRLLNEGLDLETFENKFGQSLNDAYPETAEQLIEWGLLDEEKGRLLLSKRGRFLSNQVLLWFV